MKLVVNESGTGTKEEILKEYAEAHTPFSLTAYYQNEIDNGTKRINHLKNVIAELENHQNLLEIKLGFRDDETDDIIDDYNLEIDTINKMIKRSSDSLKNISC